MIDPQVKPILSAALAFVVYKVNPVIENRPFLLEEEPDEHHGHGSHTLASIQRLAKYELKSFVGYYLCNNAARMFECWITECRYDDVFRRIRIQLVNGSDVFEI